MKTHQLFLFVLFLNFNYTIAQNITITVTKKENGEYEYGTLITEPFFWDTTRFGNNIEKELQERKLRYTKAKCFNEIPGNIECFDSYPKLRSAIRCKEKMLESDDKQFISFFFAPPIFTNEFQKEMEDLFKGKSFDLVDKQHFYQLRAIYKDFYGEKNSANWMEHIKSYSRRVSKNRFNADSVKLLSIALAPDDYYLKDFKYVDILLLQKTGRGYVYFVSFYTDKAKKRLKYYRKQLESVLRFED